MKVSRIVFVVFCLSILAGFGWQVMAPRAKALPATSTETAAPLPQISAKDQAEITRLTLKTAELNQQLTVMEGSINRQVMGDAEKVRRHEEQGRVTVSVEDQASPPIASNETDAQSMTQAPAISVERYLLSENLSSQRQTASSAGVAQVAYRPQISISSPPPPPIEAQAQQPEPPAPTVAVSTPSEESEYNRLPEATVAPVTSGSDDSIVLNAPSDQLQQDTSQTLQSPGPGPNEAQSAPGNEPVHLVAQPIIQLTPQNAQ